MNTTKANVIPNTLDEMRESLIHEIEVREKLEKDVESTLKDMARLDGRARANIFLVNIIIAQLFIFGVAGMVLTLILSR